MCRSLSNETDDLVEIFDDTDSSSKQKKKKGKAVSGEVHANPTAESQNDLDNTAKKKKKKRSKKNVGTYNYVPMSAHIHSSIETDVDEETISVQQIEAQALPFINAPPLNCFSDTEVSDYLSNNTVSIQADSLRAPSSPLPSPLKPFISFATLLPYIPELLHASVSKFKEPTPIQACCWPAALQGRDVVGIAETGSGKTLAFGLPAVTRVVQNTGTGSGLSTAHEKDSKKEPKRPKNGNKNRISVLALAPTRELAIQTHDTLSALGTPFGLTSVALYGGVPKDAQRAALKEKGAAFVVGTPGRILDLVNEGACDLSG